MQKITKTSVRNLIFDEIPIDPDWNFNNASESKMHRIHAYPAKFPSFITRKAIEKMEHEQGPIQTVGDVFCGCGTTSYESEKIEQNLLRRIYSVG